MAAAGPDGGSKGARQQQQQQGDVMNRIAKRWTLPLVVVGCAGAVLAGSLRADLLRADDQVEAHAQITAEEAARDFMAVMNVEEQLVPAMKQFMEMQAESMKNAGVEMDLDLMIRWIDENISWADFEPGLIEIYSTVFTPEELEELTIFYRSPTGRKSVEMMPVLMERGGRLGMEVVEKKMPALFELLVEQEKNAG